MSTLTPHIELVKPELTDNVNVQVFNTNFDKIDTEINNLKVDYVTNVTISTVSGISWTCRYWNSGLVECFGRKSYTGLVFNRNKGGAYYPQIAQTETLPLTFTAVPSIFMSVEPKAPTTTTSSSVAIDELYWASAYSVTTTQFGLRINQSRSWNPAGGVSVDVCFHVIGRWQ